MSTLSASKALPCVLFGIWCLLFILFIKLFSFCSCITFKPTNAWLLRATQVRKEAWWWFGSATTMIKTRYDILSSEPYQYVFLLAKCPGVTSHHQAGWFQSIFQKKKKGWQRRWWSSMFYLLSVGCYNPAFVGSISVCGWRLSSSGS